jgi:glycosyltransferase involved in cell wall biosynthesis
VLIISQEYPPVTEYYGGIGTLYGRLAPEIARLGHDIHVITLAGASQRVDPVCAGVHIHPLVRPRAWPWLGLTWAQRVEREVHRLGDFDAIVAPEFRGEAWSYARRQTAGPLVTHLHTSTAQLLSLRPGLSWRERHGLGTRVMLHIERVQAQRSIALLAPGSAVLGWARELWDLDSRPAQIVPNAIDVGAVRKAAAQGPLPDGFPRRGPTVTLASRLDGHKGAQHLLSAMGSVWIEHPDAQLVFVGRDARWGRGWMSDHLRELSGTHADHVHVLGAQPAAQYFAAVAASDLIAIPSLWESFCLAALEAMALGRPVIGTRDNGFSEFLTDGENGLLVERGSVDELAASVSRLLADGGERVRLGSAAAGDADGYDTAAIAPRFVEALARVG